MVKFLAVVKMQKNLVQHLSDFILSISLFFTSMTFVYKIKLFLTMTESQFQWKTQNQITDIMLLLSADNSLQGKIFEYRVCQGFRLTKLDFLSRHFWPLLNQVVYFEAAGAIAKIDASRKPNHHY